MPQGTWSLADLLYYITMKSTWSIMIFMKLLINYQNIAFVTVYYQLNLLQPHLLKVWFPISELWVCSRYFSLKCNKGNQPNFKWLEGPSRVELETWGLWHLICNSHNSCSGGWTCLNLIKVEFWNNLVSVVGLTHYIWVCFFWTKTEWGLGLRTQLNALRSVLQGCLNDDIQI